MKIKIVSIVSMALASVVSLANAADIKGKITLKGTPPPEKVLPMDPSCGKLVKKGTKPTTRFYERDASGGLKDVFVTLVGISGKSTGSSAPAAVLDQVACEYIPYVMAVQTMQTITVKNSDPVLHNVHPTPKPGTKNKEANKAQLPNGPDLKFQWPSAEEFLRYKCDVHPWMFAYVNVVDHPYFDVSGKDGSFTIKNVPPGKYMIKARHRKAGMVTQEIEVKSSDVTQNFEIVLK